MTKKSGDNRWMFLVLPYQIAYGPLSTLIVLYILFLHGTVIDVSYAIALGYAVSIPAGIAWGMAIDVYNRRRFFIILSFVGFLLSLIALFFVSSLILVIVIYALISLVLVANATPINLLVMDNNPKKAWPEKFSRLQMISSLGGTFGLLFSFFIVGIFPIRVLLIMLVPFCILAIVLSFLIKPDRVRSVRRSIIFDSKALAVRLFLHPFFFVRLPPLSMLKRFFSSITPKNISKSYLNTVYLGLLLFSFGSGLFNTVYPAGLKEYGLTNFTVFGIILAGYIIQTVAFYFSGKYIKHKRGNILASGSLVLRSIGYLAIGAIFVIFGHRTSIILNILFYIVAAGLAYSIFYTISNVMLFKAIGSNKRGRKLGVYSSLVALGSILGALISGYTSFYISYSFTFIAAGIAMLVASIVFYNLKRAAHVMPSPV